jgi:hypothetical protein
VRQDQPFDFAHQRLGGIPVAKPGRDDAGAALAVQLVVVGIVERGQRRRIGAREGPLHVVRQRGKPDGITGGRCQMIQPLERAQQMMAIVWVVFDDPFARRGDDR